MKHVAISICLVLASSASSAIAQESPVVAEPVVLQIVPVDEEPVIVEIVPLPKVDSAMDAARRSRQRSNFNRVAAVVVGTAASTTLVALVLSAAFSGARSARTAGPTVDEFYAAAIYLGAAL